MDKEKCPLCGKGELVRGVRQVTYRYKDKSVEVDQPGDWCSDCGECLLTAEDCEATDAAIRGLWSQVDGVA